MLIWIPGQAMLQGTVGIAPCKVCWKVLVGDKHIFSQSFLRSSSTKSLWVEAGWLGCLVTSGQVIGIFCAMDCRLPIMTIRQPVVSGTQWVSKGI